MKVSVVILTAVFFTLAPVAGPLLAQSGGQPGAFSRIGFSPRGMAMGNAMTAVEREGSYGYYNPAHAARSGETIQLDFSSAAMQFDRQLHMASAHFQLPPSAGFSVSLINARVGNIDGRSQSGYHTEDLSTSEYQMIGNFGIRFSEKVQAGVGITYNLANYHSEVPNSSSIGLDLGVLIKPFDRFSAGLAVKDLLAENRLDTGDLYGSDFATGSERYPVRLVAGMAYEVSRQTLLSFDFENRFQISEQIRTVTEDVQGFDQVRTVREEVSSRVQFLRIGASSNLHERITLRGGAQWSDIGTENEIQLSAGFSLHLPMDRFSPSVDYAFMREPNGISTIHLFALRFNI